MLKFKFLTGDVDCLEYGGKWISGKYNNGEFDYWYVLELLNVEDSVGERGAKEVGFEYWVSVYVVAPEEFKEKDKALECIGSTYEWEQCTNEMKVECILSYSGGARLFHAAGDSYKKLFKAARKEIEATETCMFGNRMDQPQNQIGSTGWDFLRGDTLAGLERYLGEGKKDSPTNNLMAKLYGAKGY